MQGATCQSGDCFTFTNLFQSTRPCRARRKHQPFLPPAMRFNPRAHAGRDHGLQLSHYGGMVSIHAPMQGATFKKQQWLDREKVSIHAPMQGATKQKTAAPGALCCFNPRAHAGRDDILGLEKYVQNSFNPRAHAGRDYKEGIMQYGSTSFNPRAHAGRDSRETFLLSRL